MSEDESICEARTYAGERCTRRGWYRRRSDGALTCGIHRRSDRYDAPQPPEEFELGPLEPPIADLKNRIRVTNRDRETRLAREREMSVLREGDVESDLAR